MKGDMVLRVPAECICGYMEAEFASAGTSEHRAIDPPLGWVGGALSGRTLHQVLITKHYNAETKKT